MTEELTLQCSDWDRRIDRSIDWTLSSILVSTSHVQYWLSRIDSVFPRVSYFVRASAWQRHESETRSVCSLRLSFLWSARLLDEFSWVASIPSMCWNEQQSMKKRLINVAPAVPWNMAHWHEWPLFIQMNFLTSVHWLLLMSIPFSVSLVEQACRGQARAKEGKRRRGKESDIHLFFHFFSVWQSFRRVSHLVVFFFLIDWTLV